MKIVLWYNVLNNDMSKQGRVFSALVSYLKQNKDYEFKICNGNYFTEKDDVIPCDLAFVWSFGRNKDIFEAHKKAGIPIIVIENGYFDKEHYTFGINKHYYLPEISKIDKTDILPQSIKARTRNTGNKIILADRGHLSKWFERLIEKYKINKEIVYRPHPSRTGNSVKNIKTEMGQVDWSEIFAVITDCSAFGNIALLNGVPVFCTKESSYKVLGNVIENDTDFNNPVKPKKADLENYFKRLCYTQYKIGEISGIFEYIKGEL